MSDIVSYARHGGVGVITMDDGKANAVSPALQAGVQRALDSAEADGVPVVLTGRPGMLSAGFDLKVLGASGQPAVDMLNGGLHLALRLLSFPTPVVIASPGHAMAMGFFLLMCGDYRIGARGNYKYAANEVAIGMNMPYSTLEIMRHRMSPAALTRAVALAETFTPDNAVVTGVLDAVVEESELLPTALSLAEAYTQLNMAAHAASKLRLREEFLTAVKEGLVKDDEIWKYIFLR
jgi:enoyl-CoA hydratase